MKFIICFLSAILFAVDAIACFIANKEDRDGNGDNFYIHYMMINILLMIGQFYILAGGQ